MMIFTRDFLHPVELDQDTTAVPLTSVRII